MIQDILNTIRKKREEKKDFKRRVKNGALMNMDRYLEVAGYWEKRRIYKKVKKAIKNVDLTKYDHIR